MIRPLWLIVRLTGIPTADQLVGLLEAVIWRLKATPWVALALEGEMEEGFGPGVTLAIARLSAWLVTPPAFEAVIVQLLVPDAVGVPVMTPVAVTRLSPAGRRVSPKVIGAVPDAVLVKRKATPTCPVAWLVLVKVGATLVLVMVRTRLVWACPPAPFTVIVLVVTVVGPKFVPEISPLVALIDSPAGSEAPE